MPRGPLRAPVTSMTVSMVCYNHNKNKKKKKSKFIHLLFINRMKDIVNLMDKFSTSLLYEGNAK